MDLSNAERMENEAIEEDKIDAAKWRALRNCARIGVMGSAGVAKQTPDNYAHITLNFWTIHEARSEPWALEHFDTFVEIAMRAQKPHGYVPVSADDATCQVCKLPKDLCIDSK